MRIFGYRKRATQRALNNILSSKPCYAEGTVVTLGGNTPSIPIEQYKEAGLGNKYLIFESNSQIVMESAKQYRELDQSPDASFRLADIFEESASLEDILISGHDLDLCKCLTTYTQQDVEQYLLNYLNSGKPPYRLRHQWVRITVSTTKGYGITRATNAFKALVNTLEEKTSYKAHSLVLVTYRDSRPMITFQFELSKKENKVKLDVIVIAPKAKKNVIPKRKLLVALPSRKFSTLPHVQQSMIRLLCECPQYTNEDIAYTFGVSPNSVRSIRAHITMKYNG